VAQETGKYLKQLSKVSKDVHDAGEKSKEAIQHAKTGSSAKAKDAIAAAKAKPKLMTPSRRPPGRSK
jgi:hypothetical protein